MNKIIITVVGKDTVGIIAAVCTYLAEHNINILDISQTIVQEYFNMMMIVEPKDQDFELKPLQDDLKIVGNSKGVQIKCQLADIFDQMHRI